MALYRSIYKYPLTRALSDGGETIGLPKGSVIRHVAEQNGLPTLWVEEGVNPIPPKVERRFIAVGTGQVIADSNFEYLGSCHCSVFVWHIFEDLSHGA